jgi:hypothetical protein
LTLKVALITGADRLGDIDGNDAITHCQPLPPAP